MVTICVIPARYGSTRFPGKVIAFLHGKPLIQYVYEKAKMCSLLDDVFVATDDERVLDVVNSFGGKALMTSKEHPTGTDRIAEAVAILQNSGYNIDDDSIIINIQADEPFIKVEMINQLIELMKRYKDSEPYIGTLVKRIENLADFQNPNIVKVVFNSEGYALYFSRSPIPFNREKFLKGFSCLSFMYKHIGIYGYPLALLKKFVCLPQSQLEKIESLEQLRALENGIKIRVTETLYDSIGIDTPEDLEVAKRCLSISL